MFEWTFYGEYVLKHKIIEEKRKRLLSFQYISFKLQIPLNYRSSTFKSSKNCGLYIMKKRQGKFGIGKNMFMCRLAFQEVSLKNENSI